MGSHNSKEDLKELDDTQKEKTTEYLDEHPKFLEDYIDRNPDLLDKYVVKNVDNATIRDWLAKVEAKMPSKVLELTKINYLKEQNSEAHHTSKYSINSLVVRRAAVVDLDLHFKDRAFNKDVDSIVLEFSVGEKPTIANGTMFRVAVGEVLKESEWTCLVTKEDGEGKKISVQVNIPPDAIIGRYKLTVEVTTQLPEGPKAERKTKPDIVVIFNPFSKADEVYMEDEKRRQEYVLNDTGIIYYGQHYRIGGMDWLFGQYEPGILDIALKLLREAPNVRKNPVKSVKKRASPVYCSRTLSAMVNCNDDDGVLYGRWDGKYDDGKSPTFWNGSVKILKEWNNTDMTEVRYGQCWVFSGVLTTVLRALGIPARSVTNFQSAHDTEFNMTIDRFIDDEGEESDVMSSGDSIWNFHVWNEGWFRRSDLPTGFDGWQAVDSTPQEESAGVYQCGPAPVKAVKNGEIFIGADTNFLFGEVNADRLTWRVNDKGEVTKLVKRETRHVGRNISTKAVGSREREDITHEYKYPEGSEKERKAFERAYAFGRKAPYHDKFNVIEAEGDVTIDIVEVGEAALGKTVTVSVTVRNTTKDNKTVIITTVINTMLHVDERKTLIKKDKIEVSLRANSDRKLVFEIPYEDYGRHLADNNVIRVFTTVRVKETDNLYVDSYDVQVETPKMLTMKCDDTVRRWEESEVSFSIHNPFPIALTGGIISLEGNGVTSGGVLRINEPIAANSTFTPKKLLNFEAYGFGIAELIASFSCNENIHTRVTKSVRILGMM